MLGSYVGQWGAPRPGGGITGCDPHLGQQGAVKFAGVVDTLASATGATDEGSREALGISHRPVRSGSIWQIVCAAGM